MSKTAWVLAGSLFSAVVSAQEFQPGVHYQTIEPPQPTNDAQKVEVVEVFNYACPHCATFQTYIHPWSENVPDNVEFRRIPVVFRASWEPFARAYYVSEALGLLDQSHSALFDALHKERLPLRTDDDIAEFFAERFDITKDDYLKAARSFAIQTKLNRGNTQAQRYGVQATPSLVINGKFVSTTSMTSGADRMISLIDHLVESEAAAIAPPAEAEEAPAATEDASG